MTSRKTGLPSTTTSAPALQHEHEYTLNPVWIVFAIWAVLIVVNFATGRALRFQFSMFLWISATILMLTSGKGVYQVFLFVLLPCILTGVTEYFGLGGITVELTFLLPAVIFLPYALTGNLKKNYPERNRLSRMFPLIPQLTLFLLACLLSSTTSHVKYPTQAIRATGVIFFIPFFFYLYSVHAISRLANVRQIAAMIVGMTAFYSAIMGLIQQEYRSYFALICRNIVIVPADKLEQMWLSTYKEAKIPSVWPDAASFGHVLIFSLPLAVGLLLTAKTTRQWLIWFASVGLLLVGVLITGNRTDLIGAAVCFLFLAIAFWTKSSKFRKYFHIALLIGVIAAAVIMVVRPTNSLSRLLMPGDWDKKTASGRTILIRQGIEMFQRSPIFGIGLDNYRYNQYFRQEGYNMQENYAHNLFIQILAETGIVGSLTFLLLFGSIFRLCHITWKHRTDSELDFFALLFLISCVGLLTQGLAENALFYVQTSSLFWLAVGIWRGRAMDLYQKENPR